MFDLKIEFLSMKIYNSSQNKLIAGNVKIAKNFFSRTLGLLNKKFLTDDEGLVIKPCCSVHTFFMRFEIDVLFVDKNNKIIALYEKVKPYKILPVHFKSFYVIELAEGSISRKGIKIGDIIVNSEE